MSKTMTKANLVRQCRETETRVSVLSLALQCVALRDPPDAEETVYVANGKTNYTYRLALYQARAPHGGIVVTIFECAGQSPSVTADYLEDLVYVSHVYPALAAVYRRFLAKATSAAQVTL
jgi:hypothetical protein